jgi:GNAT superfamily N-acetyltransferase
MQFELTDALVDELVFAMEDQEHDFVLDVVRGIVVDRGEDGEMDESDDTEGRYVEVPAWRSADGFRLMERFAASLRNPIVREELTSALDRGRGVFRAFKDTLTNRPEVEKLWFAFKTKEMRREVLDWYNALREEWGLERLGEEPEETEDLVLEDFRFRPAVDGDGEKAAGLHALSTVKDKHSASSLGPLTGSGRFSFVAETAREDFAGFILAFENEAGVVVEALDVLPDYRGLGVGEALLDRLLRHLHTGTARTLSFNLPLAADAFSRVLLREGFRVAETRYILDLAYRRDEKQE